MVHLVIATRRRTHNLIAEDGGLGFSTALQTLSFVEDLRYGLGSILLEQSYHMHYISLRKGLASAAICRYGTTFGTICRRSKSYR
jgi:hypothetical protein